MLVELGCDELQGFLFARPMSARALLMGQRDRARVGGLPGVAVRRDPRALQA